MQIFMYCLLYWYIRIYNTDEYNLRISHNSPSYSSRHMHSNISGCHSSDSQTPPFWQGLLKQASKVKNTQIFMSESSGYEKIFFAPGWQTNIDQSSSLPYGREIIEHRNRIEIYFQMLYVKRQHNNKNRNRKKYFANANVFFHMFEG